MYSRIAKTTLWSTRSFAGQGSTLGQRFGALMSDQLRSTTILCIRKGNEVVMMGDKRVTLGQSVIAKDSARKLRRAGSYGTAGEAEKTVKEGDKEVKYSDPSTVLVGFAGSTADAMTLLEKLEAKLNEFPAQLLRASVELAKEWRGDKMLRRLEASMIVADINETLEIDGSGNVLTPDSSTCPAGKDEGIVAIGSGGQYAKSAARALMKFVNAQEKGTQGTAESAWSAEMICRSSMEVAAGIDVFTSKEFDVDRLNIPPPPAIAESKSDEAVPPTDKAESANTTATSADSSADAPRDAEDTKKADADPSTKDKQAVKSKSSASKADEVKSKAPEKTKKSGSRAPAK